MKRLGIALLIGFGSHALGQFPQIHVSFSCRASRSARVIADLAKASGVNLMTTPWTSNEILVISAKDVLLGDLMTKIASVSSSEWKAEGDGFRLINSIPLQRREESRALDNRIAGVRKAIADQIAAQEKLKKSLSVPAVIRPSDSSTKSIGTTAVPIGPAEPMDNPTDPISQMLTMVDPAIIASLANNERAVFSTRPTRMQHSFAGDVSPLIDQMVSSHNRSVAKMPAPGEADSTAQPEFVQQMMNRMTRPIKSVAKTLLIVSRLGLGTIGMVQVELRIYDADGKVAFSAPSMLNMPGNDMLDMMDQMNIGPDGKPKPPPKPDAKSTPIEFAPDTKAFESAISGTAMSPSKGVNFSSELRAKLVHPEIYDPLSFFETDALLSLAKKKQKSLVASLADKSISAISMVMPGQNRTVEQYEKQLLKGTNEKILPDEKWLIIQPTDPAENRDNRIDREALGQLIRATQKVGVASLDDIAAFSLKNPSPMESGMGMIYMMLFVPGSIMSGFGGMTSWETIRLYGSLDPVGRTTLLSGGKIPISNLSMYQQTQVRKMAFGAMPALEIEDPKVKKGPEMPSFMRAFMGGDGDYRSEPTEVFSDGLPGNGTIQMAATHELCAVAVDAEGGVSSSVMSLMDTEMLATLKILKDSPGMWQVSSMMPIPPKVRIGQTTTYHFTFQLAQNVAMHQTLSDHKVEPTGQVYASGSLPSDFQKQIDDKTAELKKQSIFSLLSGLQGMGAGKIRP